MELESEETEIESVAAVLAGLTGEGISLAEIAIFVRSTDQLARVRRAVKAAGLECRQLSESSEATADCISIGTMHLPRD